MHHYDRFGYAILKFLNAQIRNTHRKLSPMKSALLSAKVAVRSPQTTNLTNKKYAKQSTLDISNLTSFLLWLNCIV